MSNILLYHARTLDNLFTQIVSTEIISSSQNSDQLSYLYIVPTLFNLKQIIRFLHLLHACVQFVIQEYFLLAV